MQKLRSRKALAGMLAAAVVIGGGIAAVTPAGAEVADAAATNWKKIWKKELKPLADKRYYTKKKSNARYYTKDETSSILGNYYTKAASDAAYALKGASYTKAESDANYYKKADVYTKTESDAKYGPYQARVAQGVLENGPAVPALTVTQILPPVSITVPAGQNFVSVNAGMTANGNITQWVMWISNDAPCATSGTGYDLRVFKTTPSTYDSASQHLVFPATAGVHTYRICAYYATAGSSSSVMLNAQTVPVGATGGTTLSASGGGLGGTASSDATPLTPAG